MYPWLWFWAPQLHLPWSGNVAQRIDPNTRWFFQGIDPSAGDADIEEKAFSVASYGRQLGLITEILIEVAELRLKGGGEYTRLAEKLLPLLRDDR